MRMPIDFETLKLFLNRKHPKLPFSEELQNKILRHLNREKYQTLQDIEASYMEAGEFLEAYKERLPQYFKHSNDYLSKALGYTDPYFRENYKFSDKAKQAFHEFRMGLAGD